MALHAHLPPCSSTRREGGFSGAMGQGSPVAGDRVALSVTSNSCLGRISRPAPSSRHAAAIQPPRGGDAMYRSPSRIAEAARARIAQGLNARLADGLDLHSQIKVAHWNVKGPHFAALHPLFETFAV